MIYNNCRLLCVPPQHFNHEVWILGSYSTLILFLFNHSVLCLRSCPVVWPSFSRALSVGQVVSHLPLDYSGTQRSSWWTSRCPNNLTSITVTDSWFEVFTCGVHMCCLVLDLVRCNFENLSCAAMFFLERKGFMLGTFPNKYCFIVSGENQQLSWLLSPSKPPPPFPVEHSKLCSEISLYLRSKGQQKNCFSNIVEIFPSCLNRADVCFYKEVHSCWWSINHTFDLQHHAAFSPIGFDS